MTADKLNRKNNNILEMALGEQPNHNKINYSQIVLNESLNYMEETIGDAKSINASNNKLSSEPLRVLNLSRMVGPNGVFQNFAPSDQNFNFLADLEPNRNEWILPFIPITTSGSTSLSLSGAGILATNGSSAFVTEVTPNIPANPGEWAYLVNRNSIVSFLTPVGTAAIDAVSCLRANISHGSVPFFSQGHGAEGLNVIPGLDVALATSIIVETSTNTSFDFMIKIGAYDFSWKSPIASSDYSSLSSGEIDVLNTSARELRGVDKFPFIQSMPKITLPKALSLNFSEGENIPKPYVMLWDDLSTSMIQRGDFYFRDETSLYYKGQQLSTGANTNYRIITVANNLSEKVEALSWDMQHHNHEGPRAISHFNLMNLGWSGSTDAAPAGITPSTSPWFLPLISHHKDNPHPQYLLRHGFLGTAEENLGNSMFGNLRFSRSDTSFLTESNETINGSPSGDSFGIEWCGTEYSEKLNKSNEVFLEKRAINKFEGVDGVFFISAGEGENIYGKNIGSGEVRAQAASTNIEGEVVGNSTLTFYNCENVSGRVYGNTNTVVMTGFENASLEVTGESRSLTLSATSLGTSLHYENHQKVMIDADEHYIRQPICVYRWIKDDPNTPTEYFYPLNMFGDSIVTEIKLYMAHPGCRLRLQYLAMDSLGADATSTTLAGATGTFTWSLGTSYGVLGSRYPNQSGSAVELGILIDTFASMTLINGYYTCSLRRF